jgi:hypothetical protein
MAKADVFDRNGTSVGRKFQKSQKFPSRNNSILSKTLALAVATLQ